MRATTFSTREKYREPKNLHGIPGVIYVLRNSGLKEGFLHIGLSRRSGWAKALELNRDKSNMIPGAYECVFEMRTQDGGAAIEMIHKALFECRCGRHDQDFFDLPQELAMKIVTRCIQDADLKLQQRFRSATDNASFYVGDTASDIADESPTSNDTQEPVVRESIFKRALSWM